MTSADLAPDASPVRVAAAGAREQWRAFAPAVIGATAYGILTVLTARVIGHLVADVITPAVRDRHLDGAMVWQIVWQLGGVVALNAAAVILRRIAAGVAYNNLIASTRRQVTRAYQLLPMRWHLAHPSGQLLSHANSDVEAIWNIFQPLPMALGVAVMLAFGFVSIFLVDVWLGVVALVVFPLLIVINYWFQVVMRARVEASQAARARVSAVADESFDGALVVKALGRADAEVSRFGDAAGELRDANVRLGRTEGIFDPMTNALPTIGSLLVVLVGAERVASGAITAADVVEVAYLFNLLAWPVRAFGWILFSLPQVAIGWKRVKPILDKAGSTVVPARTLVLPGGPIAVDVEHVMFRHDARPAAGADAEGGSEDGSDVAEGLQERRAALTDVTLRVPAGGSLAVVGATGAGKTTLAQVIAGLTTPDSGSVLYDGVPAAHAVAREERVALATQEAFVFNESTRENVALGRAGVDAGAIDEALGVAHAKGFVAALPEGEDTSLGERGSRLSGGQRQRVALARVLAGRPGLVVLDDATSAIDPAVEGQILTSLAEATDGCTSVIIAHRRSSILLADEVAFLDAGRVVAQGTHEELMATQPAYALLLTAYETQDSSASGDESEGEGQGDSDRSASDGATSAPPHAGSDEAPAGQGIAGQTGVFHESGEADERGALGAMTAAPEASVVDAVREEGEAR